MKTYALRLKKGDKLKESILDVCIKEKIKAGVVISSVGSLDKAYIRGATGEVVKEFNMPLEIISLNGTVSYERIHLHISVSDKDYNVYGGHLMNGCIVNTTVELVILVLDNYQFASEFDESTGYNEIKIIDIDKEY